MAKLNKLGVTNSLYNNIRKKAAQNKKTGATSKKPTKEMLKQERKIKKITKADIVMEKFLKKVDCLVISRIKKINKIHTNSTQYELILAPNKKIKVDKFWIERFNPKIDGFFIKIDGRLEYCSPEIFINFLMGIKSSFLGNMLEAMPYGTPHSGIGNNKDITVGEARKASMALVRFMAENYNPHHIAIVNGLGTKILETITNY